MSDEAECPERVACLPLDTLWWISVTPFVLFPWTLTAHHLAKMKELAIGGMGLSSELLDEEDV